MNLMRVLCDIVAPPMPRRAAVEITKPQNQFDTTSIRNKIEKSLYRKDPSCAQASLDDLSVLTLYANKAAKTWEQDEAIGLIGKIATQLPEFVANSFVLQAMPVVKDYKTAHFGTDSFAVSLTALGKVASRNEGAAVEVMGLMKNLAEEDVVIRRAVLDPNISPELKKRALFSSDHNELVGAVGLLGRAFPESCGESALSILKISTQNAGGLTCLLAIQEIKKIGCLPKYQTEAKKVLEALAKEDLPPNVAPIVQQHILELKALSFVTRDMVAGQASKNPVEACHQ